MKNLSLDYLHAKDGNGQEHRAYGQVVPVINAVEVWGPATWLKGSPVVTTRLTPRQARVLAIELLASAQRIEDRPIGGDS